MSEDLNVEGLQEETVQMDETKAAKAEAKRAQQIAGIGVLRGLGVSEEMTKCLALAEGWVSGDDAKKAAKEAAIEAFGGTEALKEYATTSMSEEIEKFKSLDKALSVLNNVRHFYAKRKSSGTKKVATTRIKIADDFYSVSTAYLAEIADEDSATKRELVLAHTDTVKEAITEL